MICFVWVRGVINNIVFSPDIHDPILVVYELNIAQILPPIGKKLIISVNKS